MQSIAGSLKYLVAEDAVQQIVAREPGQRASHRELASIAVACGRVNSSVMLLSVIARRFIPVLGLLLFVGFTTQANVCDEHLSRIKYIPYGGESGVDAHYDALMAARRSAVPCLIASVTITRSVHNPRPIPAGAPTMVGDVAVYLLAEVGGVDPVKLLPRKYRDLYSEMGVIVMDKYLHDRRSHPRALQRRLWRWYQTTYLPSLRKRAT